MRSYIPFKIREEAFLFLINSSFKSMPFNILVASILACDFIYHDLSVLVIMTWWLCVAFISIIRWFYSKYLIENLKTHKVSQRHLFLFILLTFLMGTAWGACYIIFSPFLSELQDFIIILVLGGLCAGSIASLSVYMPAYYAYIFPILLPVIIYHYALMTADGMILASTFLLFIIMLIVSAKLNRKLIYDSIQLSDEKNQLIDKLEVLSQTDGLTGLYNRRYFNKAFQEEINRAKRNEYPLNLVSIDIDNFKLINDTFGHPSGDRFLISTAEILKKLFKRSNDTVFRLGGDEFEVILANMTLKNTLSVCNRVQNEFKFMSQKHITNTTHKFKTLDKITLSISITHFPYNCSSTVNEVLIAADKALYQAKEQGKDKIISITMT